MYPNFKFNWEMCFGLTYISTILIDGFGFPENTLIFTNSTFSWTLGAMAWESRLTQYYGPVIVPERLWTLHVGKLLIYIGAPLVLTTFILLVISGGITLRRYHLLHSGYERI